MEWYTVLFIILSFFSLKDCHQSTDLALHFKDLLLFSTLNGTLVAVDKATGETVWSLKNKPPIINHSTSSNYFYLTDPKDGTLYMLGPHSDGIKQLPLTIPELVQISPCSSSDGLLYSASKKDSWIAVDTITGKQLYSFSSHNGIEEMCPDNSQRVVHIPTIEYRVAVMDSKSRQIKWNLTFTQFSSRSYTARHSHDLLHFSSSSDGTLTSVNSLTGERVWDKYFDSPVIGIYSLEPSGHILKKIPFTSLNHNTLQSITASRALAIKNGLDSLTSTDTILQSSFYVGNHNGHHYVMKALAEDTNIQELPLDVPLIEGPNSHNNEHTPQIDGRHYPLPEYSSVKIKHILDKLYYHSPTPTAIEKAPTVEGWGVPLTVVAMVIGTIVFSSAIASIVAIIVTRTTSTTNNNNTGQASPSPSPNNSKTGNNSTTGSNESLLSEPESNDNSNRKFKHGTFHVGKISYNSNDVIGKGSQGTVVFKGSFDSRPVAVKRVINNYFELVDREVSLLRESDQHPNVIRYFCMEEDPTFRYLALELCSATLHEYVENHKMKEFKINEKQIIWQSMAGVSHLHNLGIVHRDIKPQNVLLTVKSTSCEVKAIISDFGLCRKLPAGRGSFTAQSGILGTEGWIAPEMFQDRTRVTCAVDIFAMGCLMYYVFSAGDHPFGSPLRRQANIESDDFRLTGLIGEDKMTAEHIITAMISFNSKLRPTADEVLCHCLFWSKARQLAFFQDVSDRIESELPQSSIVYALERGGSSVIKGDWRDHISEELRQDLRKFRSYQGTSVRDLMRAMRNKKHHYRELPETLKSSLGHLPDGYVTYFTSRFPSLLVHTYKQMEICKHEIVFRSYYTSQSSN